MPRRRLSQQQRARIANNHKRRRVGQDNADQPSQAGCVIVRHGPNLLVRDQDGEPIHCVVRQNLGEVVCGDRVLWQGSADREGVVVAIQPRDTVLSRPDHAGRDKPIAANITQLIVVLAPKPEPGGYLLDQYLVAAERIGVKALICLTKADTQTATEQTRFRDQFAHYAPLGYPLIQISSKSPQGQQPLVPHLQHNVSILVGQSGVGKSSLINALLPDLPTLEGDLSEATGLGKHTTSSARLYALPEGGGLIDSPGVRSFRLGNMDRQTLQHGYPELRALLGQCKFNDCTHHDEPGCAVQKALAEGKVHPQRLASFQHLLAGLPK